MSAVPKPNALELVVDRLVLDAGGDSRLVIKRLLYLMEKDVSSGYVRRNPIGK